MKNISPEIIRSIQDAANALISSGNINPTNAQVCAHLEGVNISLISPVMREFRARRRIQEREQISALPPDLAQLLSVQMGLLWKAAQQQADAITLREHAEEDITQAEADLVLADSERERTLVQMQELKNKLKDALAVNERAVSDLASSKDELSSLTIQLENARNALTNLRYLEQEKTNLQLQNQELRDKILIMQNQIQEMTAQGGNQKINMHNAERNEEQANNALPNWPSTF
ncbi:MULTISPECIES: DNA-binding protein [Enterobacter cloacae complex]|uniref:DNA-binding protein n=1 Tax=Enterobacter cloacae complex TaxID=354276 RepID=UPI000F829CA5|nr:DNA-binding protein [Enterobacter roggenkampii]MCE1977329.1 DNA-binding protein [Enterobacter roggenkampii]RTP19144.1 DNA-binding protein [Enterobacter roggenkampii]